MKYLHNQVILDSDIYQKIDQNTKDVLDRFDDSIKCVFESCLDNMLLVEEISGTVLQLRIMHEVDCNITLCLNIEHEVEIKEGTIVAAELTYDEEKYCLGLLVELFEGDEEYEEIYFTDMWVESKFYKYYHREKYTDRETCLLTNIGVSLSTIKMKSIMKPNELNEYEKLLYPLGYVGLFCQYFSYSQDQDKYKEAALEYVRNNGSTRLCEIVDNYLNDELVIKNQDSGAMAKYRKRFMKEILSDDAAFYRRLINDIKIASRMNEDNPAISEIDIKKIDEIFHNEMFEGEFPLYELVDRNIVVECFIEKGQSDLHSDIYMNSVSFVSMRMPKKIREKFGKLSLLEVFLSDYYRKYKMNSVFPRPELGLEEQCELSAKQVKGMLSRSEKEKNVIVYNGNAAMKLSLLKLYCYTFCIFGLLFSLGMFLFINAVGVIRGLITSDWDFAWVSVSVLPILFIASGFLFATTLFVVFLVSEVIVARKNKL